MSKRFIVLITTFLLLGAAIVAVLSEATHYNAINTTFRSDGNELAAVLTLPRDADGAVPVVIFVHGDGPLPRDAHGYYRPLWNRLAQQGIASFAWDKAGVGGSSSDWLAQSMDDRADEVIAAIEYLQTRKEVDADKIGLIGYSQAGWVMPRVATKSSHPDFMVLVSGAINWRDQGDYLTRTRLRTEGASEVEIEQAIVQNRAREALLQPGSSYEEYVAAQRDGEPMSEARYEFARRNLLVDARADLANIDCPTLAIFGTRDRNVDAAESARVYREIFEATDHSDYTIQIFPDAQHGLLKARYFDTANPGPWFLIKLHLLGEDAFVPGYLDLVIDWITETTSE